MAPYKNQDEMKRILSALWERIFKKPDILSSIAGVKLVARFRYTDYKCALYIDVSGDSPTFFWDPKEDKPFDVDLMLSSETSHKFWMEDLNMALALASRKIVAKGSMRKALKLIPALKPAFALYPEVLKEMGRGDLLQKSKKPAKKALFSFFTRRKQKAFSVQDVPVFPLELVEVLEAVEPKKPSPVKREVSDEEILKVMYTIRFFEEHLATTFREGELPTEAIHLSVGQEGVAAGVCLLLRDSDCLNTTHRGHGHILAKGADLKRMMAEIYGKSDGLCSGKGGSMHVTDRGRGILGANGIVGAGYLLAMGAGLSIKMQRRDDISVVFAGDGSVNQGMFHEAMNMISVFKLPVLVIIENNLYGEFTSLERHSAVSELYRRAQAYGIDSLRLDGNDVRAVYRQLGRLIDEMRDDGKPRLVELMTYRWHGHMEGEPELYRTEEERERYKKEDPIARFVETLIREGVITRARAEEIQKVAQSEVSEAVEFARASTPPEASSLLAHVYTPELRTLFRGSIEAQPSGSSCSMVQAINQALAEEMTRDERVFLWGEDVTLGGYFNVTDGLVDTFGPDRVIDTPISENGIIGGAVGAAMTGLRPVAEILFSDFLTCCMDPIINQAAKLRYMTGGQVSIPLTIRAPVGSGIGVAAQHSQSMERFFVGVPGLIVAAPSDPYTAKGILKSAIRSNNPVIFFEHKLLYQNTGVVPDREYTLPFGKARIVRGGSDVTIVTYLMGVSVALDAATLLEDKGIDVEVVDLITLYPMDTETILESLKKTGRLATLEEGPITGGIGAEIIARCAVAAHHVMKCAPVRIAAPECPIPYAKSLESLMVPDPESVAQKLALMV